MAWQGLAKLLLHNIASEVLQFARATRVDHDSKQVGLSSVLDSNLLTIQKLALR